MRGKISRVVKIWNNKSWNLEQTNHNFPISTRQQWPKKINSSNEEQTGSTLQDVNSKNGAKPDRMALNLLIQHIAIKLHNEQL